MEDEQEKRSIEDAKKVNALFDLAIGALLGLAISVAIKTIIKSGKPFQFKNFETIAAKADAIFKKLSDLVTDLIKGGIEREWSVANAERDAQVLTLLGKEALGIKAFKAYFTHNNEGAMTAFINRAKTEEGLKLSEKIWKYSNLQLRQELEARKRRTEC
jgi:predicted lipase